MTQAAVFSLHDLLVLSQFSGAIPGGSLAGVRGDLYNHATMPLFTRGMFPTWDVLAVTAGTSLFALATGFVKLLAVFYDDEWLPLASIAEIEAVTGKDYRERRGRPRCYIIEDESQGTFSVWPVPNVSTTGSVAGDPVGVTYPTDAVLAIYVPKTTDLPTWLDLPLALKMVELGASIVMPADLRDEDMMVAARTLSALAMQMAGAMDA